MPKPRFDRYLTYKQLTQTLQSLAGSHPDLLQLESLGKSYEGRDVWLAIVTNTKTGAHDHKPATWADANIHATELSASSACLYLINKLVTGHGNDPQVTRAVDACTFYICPRVNPDGAEWALERPPRRIRSSTRPYPHDEDATHGLYDEDIDGDGRLLWMRVRDSCGPWKKSPDEPRLMVRRGPEDIDGDFYWLFPEGRIRNYDGNLISLMPRKEGLDMNRNFPAPGWRSEFEQRGAGPFPTSEPEVRNLVAFMSSHENIGSALTFHTWSGVILRPYDCKPDEEMAAEDLWNYKTMGDKGTEISGYPNISVFHDFKYHPRQIITGSFDEWAYDQRGLFAWTIEIWSPQKQAGIEEYKFIDWYRDHPFEDDLKMLKWSDEKLDGRGYVDWYPAKHPELGDIELGGWDFDYCWRNPPTKFLEKEIAPLADWAVWNALAAPQLTLHKVDIHPVGEDSWRVEVIIENAGWLPSYVTKKALERKLVRGVVFEIELPKKARLESGQTRHVGEQLEGRSHLHTSPTPWTMMQFATQNRAKHEWIVRAPARTRIKVIARHDRAGHVEKTVVLK